MGVGSSTDVNRDYRNLAAMQGYGITPPIQGPEGGSGTTGVGGVSGGGQGAPVGGGSAVGGPGFEGFNPSANPFLSNDGAMKSIGQTTVSQPTLGKGFSPGREIAIG